MGMEFDCCVEAASIFLPKFDNAGASTRSNYLAIEKQGGHTLVASVKSSGSLWLITAIDGKVMFSSKNGIEFPNCRSNNHNIESIYCSGAGNVYSVAGLYTLIKHFRENFGACWRNKYSELVCFIERNHISLGFELVTRCLGDHGSVPRTDHLVLNVAMDRYNLSPYSPLLLLRLRERFLLEAITRKSLSSPCQPNSALVLPKILQHTPYFQTIAPRGGGSDDPAPGRRRACTSSSTLPPSSTPSKRHPAAAAAAIPNRSP